MSSGELTLGRWLRDRARVTPRRVAIDSDTGLLTYAALDRRAGRWQARLHDAGARHGDRVATLTLNSAEQVAVLFACARAGLVLVPLNWRLAPPELAYQIDQAEVAVLLVGAGQQDAAEAMLAVASGSPTVLALEPAEGDPAPAGEYDQVDVAADDPLLLIYTSGTTGRPKGAMLSHANCFWTNLSFERTASLTGDDVVLQVLPQCHVAGWNVQPLLAFWQGATVVLERSFDPARALALIADKRVTTMMGVPATYLFLSQAAGFETADLSSLRLAVVGGAPMPEVLLRRWHDRGVQVVQGYGLTEAAPNVLCLPPEDAARKLGCAGKPYPHVDVALEGPDGALLEGPAQGELVVRGPNVFSGYWRDPEATAEAIRGGWLHTGDVAERDDEGFYWIRDRVKDLYVSGGENVYPAEVEAALHEHPDVADVAVIGIPDERWGEAGAAMVVLRPGATADAEQLRAHCAQRLGRFKVPREVRLLDELPRSAANKVLKTELRRTYSEESAR